MAEHITLQQLIDKAVGEYASQNGGGFPLAYVAIVEMSNADGVPMMVVASPPDQQTYRSMGLAQYAGAWYTDDAQRVWACIGDNDSDGD